MTLVDDSSGWAMGLFSAEATTWAVAHVLRDWVERHGVPRAILRDGSSFNHRDPVPLTQFGRMCGRLDIELIRSR